MLENQTNLKTAIILAGGKGTRLRPLTDFTPKPLLPVNGKPIIEHIIDNLKRGGVKHIILSVGYKADKIKDYFGDGSAFGVKIDYCIEDTPLGTGGAIKLASRGIVRSFIALNGDNLADFDYDKMYEVHRRNNARITMALYPVEDVTQFGIVKLDGEIIVEFIDKPQIEEAPSNLNNAGAYIIEQGVLDMLPEGMCSIEKDCFEKLAVEGVIFAYSHEDQWFPTDNIEKYNNANKKYKE
ncbi:MAG: nucleotidyltransferase family protein [Nanoarchaeota archaeon]|nr:nucleotidyltransferase family protein [Nanoarchaeota archaeon]